MLLRLGGRASLESRRRYWLGRCEGFVVRDPDGHAGTVDHLRFGSRRDAPDALALRTGPFGLRRRLIAANRIVRVSPEEGTILVVRAPVSVPTGFSLAEPARAGRAP